MMTWGSKVFILSMVFMFLWLFITMFPLSFHSHILKSHRHGVWDVRQLEEKILKCIKNPDHCKS